MIVEKLVLSTHEAEQAWKIYNPAMSLLEEETPFPQCLSEDEFRNAMSDPAFLKYLIIDADELVRGILIVATDMKKVPWLSHRYFAKKYPKETLAGTIFYIISIVMDPSYKEAITAPARMIRMAIEKLPAQGVFCHDFSLAHHKRFPKFSEMMAKLFKSTTDQTDSLVFCEGRKT